MRLERLTYVHDGDGATIGQLISEARGTIRFGEGSGLIEVSDPSTRTAPVAGAANSEAAVRITSVTFSSLPAEVQLEIGENQVPCILGHAGVETVILLPPRSCARVTGALSDLRGKIRYALARVGWSL